MDVPAFKTSKVNLHIFERCHGIAINRDFWTFSGFSGLFRSKMANFRLFSSVRERAVEPDFGRFSVVNGVSDFDEQEPLWPSQRICLAALMASGFGCIRGLQS